MAMRTISFVPAFYTGAKKGKLSEAGQYCACSGLVKWTDAGLSSHPAWTRPFGTRKFQSDGRSIRRENLSTLASVFKDVSVNDPNGAGGPKPNSKSAERKAAVRGTITGFLEEKSGYSWLLGPLITTAVIVMSGTTTPLIELLQRNFLLGLATVFGIDFMFVIAADLFLMLTDKLGHHQRVAGGPPPWVGPWEYTGYPKGYPTLLHYLSYAAVGIAVGALFISVLLGKFPIALVTFGPYLALIFVQVAYERILGTDRLPVVPLVPIIYTFYRFFQLARGLFLAANLRGQGSMVPGFLKISCAIWVMYLSTHLTQLPWLYSTWNSNRAV